MTTSETKATPEQIAQITASAIRQLAQTHIIITKDELRALIQRSVAEADVEMWGLITSTYLGTAEKLRPIITSQQYDGFMKGADLLQRMQQVVLEEKEAVFGATEQPQTT